MIHRFSERIVASLVDDGHIPSQNREWCVYILETRLLTILGLSFLLFLGVLFGKPFQTVVFLILFWSVRERAGGYHSGTPKKCYILSTVVFSVCMLVGDIIAYYSGLQWSLLILSNFVLLSAPINSVSLNLTEEEYLYNRKMLRMVQCVDTMIVAFFLLRASELSAYMILGYTAAALSVAAVKIQEYTGGKTKNERVDESFRG